MDRSLSRAGKRSAGGRYSVSLGCELAFEGETRVPQVGGKRCSRQLGFSMCFFDYWFPAGNQVLELTEKHKPALDLQLTGLQVSDPANMPDIPFHILYLSQGFAAQDPLKNAALAVTAPCGFPLILLHGTTELFLLKVSAVLQEGSQMFCSAD